MTPGVLLAWLTIGSAGLSDVPVPSQPTFTSFEGPVGAGTGWREIDGWDPTGISGAGLCLGADGSLALDQDTSGTVTFHQSAAPDDEVDTASFTSAPLVADEILLGHPSMTFRATLDAPDADFYVELLDVDPAGSETWVNDGFLAGSHRRPHADPEPVPVGEATEFCVAIRAHHHRFRASNRVRVRVSGGSSSKLTPPPAPVTVAMETGRTACSACPDLRAQDSRTIADVQRLVISDLGCRGAPAARTPRCGGTPRSPRRSRLG